MFLSRDNIYLLSPTFIYSKAKLRVDLRLLKQFALAEYIFDTFIIFIYWLILKCLLWGVCCGVKQVVVTLVTVCCSQLFSNINMTVVWWRELTTWHVAGGSALENLTSTLSSPCETSLGTAEGTDDATATPPLCRAGDAAVATLRASVYRRLPTNYGRSCFLFGSPPWINRCIHKYPVFV